jgi:hypothetical protein
MLRLLIDENIDHDIVRGLRRRLPDVDVVTAQEVGLLKTPDPEILEWATINKRILVTHDVQTMPMFAYERIGNGESFSGVFIIPNDLAINIAIEQLIFHIECSNETEWINQVHYLPI